MPKDNEVDEKVIAMVCLVQSKRYPHFAGVEMQLFGSYEPRIGDEFYSAATVAELRAEVEKARIAGIDACDKLTTLWQKDIDRADTAERRAGELEDLAGAFLEAADARDNEETSTQYPEHERRLREYKAAHEDLSKSLTGADQT